MIADAPQRKRALDPNTSFIVQAPAGSGKTELLTQRFLKLLSVVKQPEEIVALTFTKRAASEMRQRIAQALQMATMDEPKQEHKKLSWQLAKEALQNSKTQGWDLESNPNRLRLITMDALAGTICKQIPTRSKFVIAANVSENSNILYRHAVTNLLNELCNAPQQENALSTLLSYYDNNADKLSLLLSDMLPKRDQWLRYVCHPDLAAIRLHLESSLQKIAVTALKNLQQIWPEEMALQLQELAIYASNNLDNDKAAAKARDTILIDLYHTTAAESIESWQWLCNILLNKKMQVRKIVTAASGFPAASSSKDKAEKEHRNIFKNKMQQFLNNLGNRPEITTALQEIIKCPPTNYNQDQWQVLSSLCQLLPRLIAHLHLVFNQHNEIDFVEVNMQAQAALGEADQPTDLALQLDYKIQHLLIDEFQDTAYLHYRLIEKMLSGWQNDDGRSIFIVGDPMQSIYRFRDAEVGLFLHTKQLGLADVKLESLTLSSNFRSTQTLINWINKQCQQIFPANDNISQGAISYSKATAMIDDDNKHSKQQSLAVQWLHGFATDKSDAASQEANKITATILNLQNENPQHSIAILVRSRRHLPAITEQLRLEAIDYCALDIDSLANQACCIDLLALTQALSHPANDTAWYSILRAPWCGLKLQSIYQLAMQARVQKINYISEFLLQQNANNAITDNADKLRFNNTIKVIKLSLAEAGRKPFSIWLEQIWYHLGGPHSLKEPADLSYCQAYFNLINQLDQQQTIIDDSLLKEKLANTFVSSPTVQTKNAKPVQIMTIHKSKGLEFDHVFIPGLQRKSPPQNNPMLRWLQANLSCKQNQFILAPLTAADSNTTEPIYNYLKQIEAEKLAMERIRLFYVAITRAKKSVYFSAAHVVDISDNSDEINLNDEDLAKITKPASSSFAALISDNYISSIKQQASLLKEDQQVTTNTSELTSVQNKSLWRRKHLEKLETVIGGNELPAKKDNKENPQPQPMSVSQQQGIIIHNALAELSQINSELWTQYISQSTPSWQQQLAGFALDNNQRQAALELITFSIKQATHCNRGQWILSNKLHKVAASEKVIFQNSKQSIQKSIIDRTFISDSFETDNQTINNNPLRFIVDYKCSLPDCITAANITGLAEQVDAKQNSKRSKTHKNCEINNTKLALEYPDYIFNYIEINKLNEFIEQQLSAHQTQLHRYANLYTQIDPKTPICLGLYFPLLQLWVYWSYENEGLVNPIYSRSSVAT